VASISVKWKAGLSQAAELERYVSALRGYGNEIKAVRAGLSFQVKAASGISAELSDAAARAEEQAADLRRLCRVLEEAFSTYRQTEKNLADNAGKANPAARKAADSVFQEQGVEGLAFPGAFAPGLGGVLSLWENCKDKVRAATTFDEDLSTDGVLLSGSGAFDSGLLQAGGEYAVGSYSASAALNAQLFDDDGNFAPGVSGEVGVSGSLFDASGEVGYGNEIAGAALAGSVTVLAASAAASGSLGFTDGEFSAKASASAEATLAEAEGEASAEILGVEGTVSGSVGVGVGAHLDAGYADGVLSFDVGAYVGVGASVGFEVDIGGAVDAVCDFAESLLSWW
jgi:hypothetical protein